MHGWRCAGGGGRKRRSGAQAAGGGVGTESEGKGEERERKRKLGLGVNSTVVIGCTNLKHWKIGEKKKTFGRYIGLAERDGVWGVGGGPSYPASGRWKV